MFHRSVSPAGPPPPFSPPAPETGGIALRDAPGRGTTCPQPDRLPESPEALQGGPSGRQAGLEAPLQGGGRLYITRSRRLRRSLPWATASCGGGAGATPAPRRTRSDPAGRAAPRPKPPGTPSGQGGRASLRRPGRVSLEVAGRNAPPPGTNARPSPSCAEPPTRRATCQQLQLLSPALHGGGGSAEPGVQAARRGGEGGGPRSKREAGGPGRGSKPRRPPAPLHVLRGWVGGWASERARGHLRAAGEAG